MSDHSPSTNSRHQAMFNTLVSDISKALNLEVVSDDFANITNIGSHVKELASDNNDRKLLKRANYLLQLEKKLNIQNSALSVSQYRQLTYPALSPIKKAIDILIANEAAQDIEGALPPIDDSKRAVSDSIRAIGKLSYSLGITLKAEEQQGIREVAAQLLKQALEEGGAYDQMPEIINAFKSLKNGLNLLYDATVLRQDSSDQDLMQIIDNLNQDCNRAGILNTQLSELCDKTIKYIDDFTEIFNEQESDVLNNNQTIGYRLKDLLATLSAGDSPARQAFRPAYYALKNISTLPESDAWQTADIAQDQQLLEHLSEARKVAQYYASRI